MEIGAAIIESNENLVRRFLGDIDDHCAHLLEGCKISCRRDRIARCHRVNGIDAIILVASLILCVENVLAVEGPKVLSHRSGCVRRNRTGFLKRLAAFLDPDVPYTLEGFEERNMLSVW